ncbi:PadR family transcriptional regulator [Microbacterium sp. HJ5]
MPQRELTTTAYLTLGLLASRDWSAYQLAEQLGRGVDKLWPRADRQRYNTLKRLLVDGLVTSRVEQSGRRGRTVYSITDAGRGVLAEWLTAEASPPALEFEGMIRVLISDQGTIDDLRRNLETMRDQAVTHRALFARYADYISETGGTFPERRHLFALSNTFMIGHYDHIIAWVDWALGEIAHWPDPMSPAADQEQVRSMLAAGRAAWRASQAEDVQPEAARPLHQMQPDPV